MTQWDDSSYLRTVIYSNAECILYVIWWRRAESNCQGHCLQSRCRTIWLRPHQLTIKLSKTNPKLPHSKFCQQKSPAYLRGFLFGNKLVTTNRKLLYRPRLRRNPQRLRPRWLLLLSLYQFCSCHYLTTSFLKIKHYFHFYSFYI